MKIKFGQLIETLKNSNLLGIRLLDVNGRLIDDTIFENILEYERYYNCSVIKLEFQNVETSTIAVVTLITNALHFKYTLNVNKGNDYKYKEFSSIEERSLYIIELFSLLDSLHIDYEHNSKNDEVNTISKIYIKGE
jgi:hypothetical protein